MLKPWSIDPATSVIERAVVYTFHSALSTRWRRDRLLLAGDAAHQMPPFLGQGMCSGLRDAANLAWKLDAVIKDEATDNLLDTYETERSEHVRAFIELAVELAGVIQTTDPERAQARDRDLIANPTMLRPITPRLGRGLHGDEPAPAGTRAAQPRLADDTLLDDKVGYRFAVLATPRFAGTLLPAKRNMQSNADVVFVTATGPAEVLPRRTSDRGSGDSSRSPHPRRGVDRSRTRCGSRTPFATLFNRTFTAVADCRRLELPGDFAWPPHRVPTNAVDHVGSLKRPPELVQAWRAWEDGKLPIEQLRQGAGRHHPRCRRHARKAWPAHRDRR